MWLPASTRHNLLYLQELAGQRTVLEPTSWLGNPCRCGVEADVKINTSAESGVVSACGVTGFGNFPISGRINFCHG